MGILKREAIRLQNLLFPIASLVRIVNFGLVFICSVWTFMPFTRIICFWTLKLPITTIVICFVICLWFYKSFLQTVWTQIRLLLWSVSTLFACMKNKFKKFARIYSKWHKQTTFSDAGFLGILRIKIFLSTRGKKTYYTPGIQSILKGCIVFVGSVRSSVCPSIHPCPSFCPSVRDSVC